MFSASNKRYLLAAFFLSLWWPVPGIPAVTGEVAAVGMGREAGDAIANLLKTTVNKYCSDEPGELLRSVLTTEILPNASSFVQSYKVLESGRGTMSVSANVDLDVVRALLRLRPELLGEAPGAKALLVVKGARLPDGSGPVDPYATVETAARERLQRRGFTVVTAEAGEIAEVGAGEAVSAPELLRGLGAKAEARVAFGVSSRLETYESENSHTKEERIVLEASLMDVKEGTVLGRGAVQVTNPKSRREQYAGDLQRALAEEGKDLFHEVFVGAGRRLVRAAGREEVTIVRVLEPPSAALMARFRVALEGVRGVKSVVEYRARRGAFDFAVRPVIKESDLAKAFTTQAPEDLAITIAQVPDTEVDTMESPRPQVSVRLAMKTAGEVPPAPGGGNDAKP